GIDMCTTHPAMATGVLMPGYLLNGDVMADVEVLEEGRSAAEQLLGDIEEMEAGEEFGEFSEWRTGWDGESVLVWRPNLVISAERMRNARLVDSDPLSVTITDGSPRAVRSRSSTSITRMD
ncbi:MAG TPA: hypothetical protein VHG09_10920, partial [Longimicrobiales bacterium]|nr:hypothetical protein [Longimicrobiales bacterium]